MENCNTYLSNSGKTVSFIYTPECTSLEDNFLYTKKIFKHWKCSFSVSLLSPLWEGCGPLLQHDVFNHATCKTECKTVYFSYYNPEPCNCLTCMIFFYGLCSKVHYYSFMPWDQCTKNNLKSKITLEVDLIN